MWMQDGKENGKKEGEGNKKVEKEVTSQQEMQMNNSDLVRRKPLRQAQAESRKFYE